MSADAIAVFRPKHPEKLTPFLDLDEDSEESKGLYAEPLGDGAMLVHTFQPFEVFEENPAAAHEWLAQFGSSLPDIHDDPRGLFFFPDECEPMATTYEGVLDEVGEEGLFVPTDPLGAAAAAGIDVGALQALANQLLGGADPNVVGGSFEMAKLFEGMNQKLVDALGLQGTLAGAADAEDEKGAVRDEEFASDESPPEKKK